METKTKELLKLRIDNVELTGELIQPENSTSIVIFSHGSGSSRFSPRNNYVAKVLQERNISTFLFDLLSEEEDLDYSMRFDIELLTKRLIKVTDSLLKNKDLKEFDFGYFGASTGAASALMAAAHFGNKIKAVVSRGGRPDMSMEKIHLVMAPTLLLVGERDAEVLWLNRKAFENLNSIKELKIIKGATHLFEEPGTLEEVAEYAAGWFEKYL